MRADTCLVSSLLVRAVTLPANTLLRLSNTSWTSLSSLGSISSLTSSSRISLAVTAFTSSLVIREKREKKFCILRTAVTRGALRLTTLVRISLRWSLKRGGMFSSSFLSLFILLMTRPTSLLISLGWK